MYLQDIGGIDRKLPLTSGSRSAVLHLNWKIPYDSGALPLYHPDMHIGILWLQNEPYDFYIDPYRMSDGGISSSDARVEKGWLPCHPAGQPALFLCMKTSNESARKLMG